MRCPYCGEEIEASEFAKHHAECRRSKPKTEEERPERPRSPILHRGCELKKVEVVGDKIIAHMIYEEDIPIQTPETAPHLDYWWKQGYIMIIPIGAGYAYGLQGATWTWYEIDLREKKEIRKVKDPRKDRDFILSLIIHPEEWGKWVEEIPVIWK